MLGENTPANIEKYIFCDILNKILDMLLLIGISSGKSDILFKLLYEIF